MHMFCGEARVFMKFLFCARVCVTGVAITASANTANDGTATELPAVPIMTGKDAPTLASQKNSARGITDVIVRHTPSDAPGGRKRRQVCTDDDSPDSYLFGAVGTCKAGAELMDDWCATNEDFQERCPVTCDMCSDPTTTTATTRMFTTPPHRQPRWFTSPPNTHMHTPTHPYTPLTVRKSAMLGRTLSSRPFFRPPPTLLLGWCAH